MARQLSDIILHQDPLAFPPTATVKDACRAMRDRRVGAVLVTESGRLVGIFTGRDAVARVLAEGRPAGRTRLSRVMTQSPQTMPPGRSAVEALRLMQDCGCRHVPVVDGDKVVGIVSRGDFRGREIDRLDEETGLWERISEVFLKMRLWAHFRSGSGPLSDPATHVSMLGWVAGWGAGWNRDFSKRP